ncbi:MAG TPA: rRNA maturation RNase YbeY [Acidisarcina sp.]
MIIIEPPLSFTKKRAPFNKRDLQQFLAQAQKAVPLRGVVSILLTSDEAVRDLNHRFRHKNKPTDVLSFPAVDLGDLDPNLSKRRPQKIAGDMAISIETAARQAHSHGHDLALEIKILILHGLLHLSGLDHEADSGEMAAQEQLLRKQLNLPAGLIARTLAKKTPTRRSPTGTARRTPSSRPVSTPKRKSAQ